MILGTFGQNVVKVHFAATSQEPRWNLPGRGGSSEMDAGTLLQEPPGGFLEEVPGLKPPPRNLLEGVPGGVLAAAVEVRLGSKFC